MLSEALEIQRGALIPGRRSTLVVLTAGEFARGLTPTLEERLKTLDVGGERVVGELVQEPAAREMLQARIAKASEAARLRDPEAEIEIKVLLSTWDLDDTDVSQVLGDFSALLTRLAAGNQTLTLALLMPPSTARAAQLRRSAEAIRSAASALGTLPFFTSAFVYQLPAGIFCAETAGADGFASRDDLLELLARNAGDQGAVGIIQHHAVSPHEAAKGIDGEQAGLSTLGLQRVVYLQHELLRYLQARFQWELFHKGLFNPALVSESRQAALTRQAEDLLSALLRDLGGRLSALVAAPAYGALAGVTDVTPDAGLPPLGSTDAERAIRTGEERLQGRLDEALDACERRLRRELDLALDVTPGFFADGLCFLGAITGCAAEVDPPGESRGLFRVAEQFCTVPLQALMRTHLQPRLSQTITRYGLTPSDDDRPTDPPLSPPEPSVRLLSPALRESSNGVDAPVRFLDELRHRLIEATQQHAATAADSRGLILALGRWLIAEDQLTRDVLKEIETELELIAEQTREIKRDYPLWRLWKLGARMQGMRKLQQASLALAQQETALIEAGQALARLFGEMFERILWPYHVRVLMVSGLRDRHGQVQADFDQYTGTLRERWDEEWRLAQEIERRDSWTATTVNSLARFAVVYDRKLYGVDWVKQIASLWAFVPRAAETYPATAPSYVKLQSLSDHFHAPLYNLTDRTLDYGQVLFEDARDLHILDIIELLGESDSRAFLKRILDKTRSLPEFSNGLIPRLEVAGLFKRQRLLRSIPQVKDALHARYAYLFGDSDDFSDVADPEVIDITAFTFGFPASILHVLASVPAAPPVGGPPSSGAMEIVLDTRRAGSSRTVTVTLEGKDDRRLTRALLIDTGASCVTLPASLIPQLGLNAETLGTATFQTANGSTEGPIGTLPAVWLNEQRIPEVKVAFVEDERLGGEGLLGMSVLSRFRLTIDDEQDRMVLAKL